MQLGNANLGDKGDEGKEPPSLGPRVGAAVGVERCTGDAKLGDKGDEGKEPSSLEPRVGAAVGVERCNLGTQAKLGDKGALRKFLKKYTTEIHLCEYPGLNTPGISVEDREIPQNVKWHGDGTENTPFKIRHLKYTIWNTPFGIHHLEYPIWNTPGGPGSRPLGALAAFCLVFMEA